MGYIRKFESYKKAKKENRLEVSKPIEEAVIMKVDNTFKVKSIADVTQTLINAYVKKVKEETGKELKDFFSEMDLAEALVKYAIENGLDVDCIPSNALLGENAESAEDDSNEEEATEEEVEETEEEATEEEVAEEEVEETEEEVAEEEVEETEEEEIVAEEEVEETEEEATEEEEVEETEEAEEEISSEELPV